MDFLQDLWSPATIVAAAFVMGWAAETAQTFIPRALALSLLAWLQTLPEFAVEAVIAWHQERDLMIANLTGSLRLLVGLGWPMVFFTHFFFRWKRTGKFTRSIELDDEDSLGVLFVFIAVLYFIVIWAKGSLTAYDSIVLIAIYTWYLLWSMRLPVTGDEEDEDLPWIGKRIVRLPRGPKIAAVTGLFLASGIALYFSAHPFVEILQSYALRLGVPAFVFIQWIAPFLSEFPEKLSAFNWARQQNKANLAVMNFVNSNINQWTMLAAMIPLVYGFSLGHFEPITFTKFHRDELALTIAQSLTGGLILLNLSLSIWEAAGIFLLFFTQFVHHELHEPLTWAYAAWGAGELVRIAYDYAVHRRLPRALPALRAMMR